MSEAIERSPNALVSLGDPSSLCSFGIDKGEECSFGIDNKVHTNVDMAEQGEVTTLNLLYTLIEI
jgi:hypothetical protein